MKLNYIKVFVPILVILVGAFLYTSRHEEKGGATIVPLAERYALAPENVASVAFNSPKGEARFVASEGQWVMSKPGAFPADPAIVNTFLTDLMSIQPDRILENQPEEKIAEFGLDSPQATILLADARQQVLLELSIGDTNPSGSSYYARVKNDGAILTLPIVPIEERILSHDPNSFRSRQILQVNREKLARIEVAYPATNTGYTLEREHEGWMITAPFSHRAKERLIDATLIHLEDLKADEFLPTPKAEAGIDPAMGLAVPQGILTLTDTDGTVQTLTVGAPGGELTKLYATSSSLPEVFLAQQHIAEKLSWTDADLKEDRLVIFASDSIGAIEVRLRGADNLLLEKAADNSWTRTKPTTQKFSGGEIESLLETVLALAPQDYMTAEESETVDEADLGFSEYTLKLELKKADTFNTQVLTIGKLHRRRGYFTRDSLTPGVYLLPETQVRAVEAQIEKIRGGDAPKEDREAWSEKQKALAEENAKMQAEADKKAKKRSPSKPKERGGTGLR